MTPWKIWWLVWAGLFLVALATNDETLGGIWAMWGTFGLLLWVATSSYRRARTR